MVAIVSGMRNGLDLTSAEVLGFKDIIGGGLQGRNGQGVNVNIALGQLVLQDQDDLLVARGQDALLVRTYNSSGSFNDDNGDGWTSGVGMLRVFGTLNTAGSAIQRVGADGGAAAYDYDAARGLYVSYDGAGAYDTIAFIAADGQFEWHDGATGVTARYEGTGAYRLLASRDTSGNTLSFAYGANGFLSSVTTGSGETLLYDYAGNNLSQVRTTVAGVTTTRVRYGYDTSNRLTTVTVDLTPGDNSIADGKVYRTTYTYDGTSKRIASITQSDGTSVAFTYVDTGGGNYKVATVRDGANQTTTFTYGNRFTTVTDPMGFVTRYDYNGSSQITAITGPAVGGVSASRQFTYDAWDNVTSVTDGEGRTVTYQYDDRGNQVLERDAAGRTTVRTFDARNQLLSETTYTEADPDGAGAALPTGAMVARQVYDAAGRNQLRFAVSAEGRVTEYRYDGFGQRVATITYAAATYPFTGVAPESAFTETALATWSSSQDLTATQRVDAGYDGRGQLQTLTSYARVDASGAGILDGSESVEHYVYDAAGLLLQTVDGRGATTTYSYDGMGRKLTATDALGQVTVTQYDDAGRKTLVTLANGLVTTSSYDAAGRLVSVAQTGPAGGTLGETRYFYDADNRLRMTQDPTGVRQWTLYDEAGRKSAEIDGNGSMREFVYDRSDRLVGQYAFGTAVDTALLVNGAGLPVLTVTAASLRPTGAAADATLWRQYDASGRLVREATATGTGTTAAVREMRYDGAGRLVQTVRYATLVSTAAAAGTLAFGAVGLPPASSQDRIERNFYDADGRLVGALDAEGYLTTFSYTAAGQLYQRLAYATPTSAALRASGTLAQLLPAASDSDQRELTFHDARGHVLARVDAEGYATEYVYDASGNETLSVRYAKRAVLAGDPQGAPVYVRPAADPADRSTARSYDALNRLLQETSAENVVTQYAYDSVGNLVATVKAAGSAEVRTLLARYDLQGRLLGELSAEGAALLTGGQTQAQVDAIWAQYGTSHAYDAASRRISSTDPLGNRTLFFYDADGALTHTVNALGEVLERRYDAHGRITDTIAYVNRIGTAGLTGGLATPALSSAVAAVASAALDSRTTYTYTREGQVASATDPLGTVATSTYNAFGEEIARQLTGTGINLLETYSVDRLGHRTGAVADAAGVNAITSAVYDAFGRVVRSVDANGNVREQGYDRLGRLILTRDPLNAARSTSYDAFGRVLTQTDALGNVTRYAYDPLTRAMTVTTAEGVTTTTAYTRHGQVQSITDGRGQLTRYVYDRSGNLVRTELPQGTTSSTYDAAGRLTETTDANGKKVAYGYDAANRVLTRRVDPGGLNLTTSWQYDGKGQRISVTDANGVVTSMEYDRKGRVLKQTVDPTGLNLQTTYAYDASGNVLTVRSPAGSLTRYAYDALGRRVQERVDPSGLDLQRTWSYDRNGNVVASTDARGNVTRYAYDAADRLVFTLGPLGQVSQNTYDAEGRVVKTVSYASPVAAGGLGAGVTAAQIQPLVMAQVAQDLVEHRVYDRDGRLAATVDGMGAVVRYAYDANGNVVARTAYATRIDLGAWVPGTLPTPLVDSARDASVRTVYDAMNRATYTVDGVGAVVALMYDASGNVVQRTAYAAGIATTTAATQSAISSAVAAVANVARDATVRYAYDAAGRVAWVVDGVGAVTQKVYDKNGNVVRQVAYATPVPAGAAASSVSASAADRSTAMAYDAANRLVFQVDALRGVTEQAFDADGHVTRRTAYATAVASVPPLGQASTVSAIRNLLAVNAAGDRTSRFGYDAAGRQVLSVDAMGAVTETRYDAAGNVTSTTAYANTVDMAALATTSTLAGMRALLTPRDAADRTTRNAYDAAGQLVYTVDAVGAVTANQYDALGRVTRTTRYATPLAGTPPGTLAGIASALQPNAADQVTAFTYNAAGLLLSLADAEGKVESYGYDALGRKLSFVNKSGFTWNYSYDAAGRLFTETAPTVQLATVSANAAGPLVVTAPVEANVVTRMAYDALGNLTQRTEAVGRPEERTTRYEYDALGRQVRVVYPPVGVYDAAADAVTTNGATGVAGRVETLKTLETRTFYDTLGNAVANRDVGDAVSQKAYDVLGRVAYEVDALGYVTGYVRNAFGEVTALVRYGAGTTLANVTITQATDAAGKAQVEAALAATGFDHSKDRALLSSYDRLGRLVEKTEPTAYVYDTSATGAAQAGNTGRKTRNTYDAFGQLVQVKVLRNEVTDTWAATTHFFDRAGHETATVDALGYLTVRTFDAAGNLAEIVEFANAVPAGWSPGASLPASSLDDRRTTFSYDRLDRKTSETRVQVEYSTGADGTSIRGNLTTRFGYDAVGNQTWVTDAAGNTTYTYYDALGRVKAIAAPARSSTTSGSTLIPLTTFTRDAYGNVLVRTDYANGAVSASATAFQAPAADGADRRTLSAYDSFGHAVQTTDANGASSHASYDAYGHVVKQWQPVTGNDGVTRTAFEVSVYDKLGQLVETRTPASTSVLQGGGVATVSQAQAGLVISTTSYNAFGEVTRRGTEAGSDEYFEYDNAGRLWRTNAGDGVDRINLYDAQGNVTAEIRSSGSGRDNIDLKTVASAQAAAENPYTRRVDMQYDLLGRVTAKVEAARQELQGGVSVQWQYTTASVVHSANGGVRTNDVALGWNSLAGLGSGDIRVTIEYRTPVVTNANESGESGESGGGSSTSGGTLRSYTSGVLVGDANASGARIQWTEAPAVDMGLGSITRITVLKKDRNGNWVMVIDQAPGYGANEITVAAPADPGASVSLQLRAAGSPGDTGWWSAGLVNFESGLRFNAAGLSPGSYEYRVLVKGAQEATARVTASGSVTISMPPLNTIPAQMVYGQPGVVAGIMTWAAPGAGYTQVFRYRANGSNGAWSTLAIQTPRPNFDGVDTRGLPPGTYQFELLWTVTGQNSPNSHATGTFTVIPPAPSYYVPPVNYPPINGVYMSRGTYGGTLAGVTESGETIYAGGTTVPALVWPAANVTVAQYRASGGAWTNLPMDNNGQTMGESGLSGLQKALLYGIGPGSYDFRIFVGQPPTAQATGVFTIYAKNPDYYTTVYVQVPTYTPVISHYTPVYETRYGQRQNSYNTWVPYQVRQYDENGQPAFTESGQPIYVTLYRMETHYYWETYSYQVQVGQTPVYATDENGHIIYSVTYTTQAQQQLVTGSTPAPTYASNTPGYSAGYWTQAVPTQYAVALGTSPGSGALSTSSGSVIGQAAALNGDARWLRPTVKQKFDRWGNVIEITDPRAEYWKTTYRFNANNQMIQQVLPDAGGGAGTTSIYYDALGRQVAVRDARGNVNGQVFDAGGNLVEERHAIGVVRHAYDAFGEKVRTIDAESKVVQFSYDRMGHLLRIDKGVALVYRGVGAGGVVAEVVGTRMLSDAWTYDQLGRKLSQTNGNGETLRYTYDLAGNLVATTQPLGQVTRAAFDAQGRKIAEVDPNGYVATWTYYYFGQLRTHTDLGGIAYTYQYDNARQLVSQSSGRGQSLTYRYDAAGQLTMIRDAANDKTTTFVYDLSGRKVRERVVQGGVTYQDNHMGYDARGNLRDVADGRAHVVMEYDQVGNRTRVATYVDYQGVGGEAASSTDRYFQYDAMNRQVVVDAVDAAGNLGQQGHRITYDGNGNRTSDYSWGTKVAISGGVQVIIGYDEDNKAIYTDVPVTYTATTGYSAEEYRYDALNRLTSVVRDGVQIDVRHYDGADRVIESGPLGNLPVKYAEIINQGLAPDEANGKETRVNRYDANGRLMHQTVRKSDNTLKLNISWDPGEAASDLGRTFYPDGYDAAGNVRGYTVTNHEAGVINEYTMTLARFEGYQGLTTHGESTKQLPGDSTQQYDANGFLVGIVDSTQPANNRTFVNDANGKALYVNQAGNVQRQLIVNGEVLGIYGAGVDPNRPASGYNNNPNFANIVDFDFGYARVSANYPSPSPGAYTVRTGDTLQSIAQGAYGDSSLWYRIAEANGLGSNNDLRVGQTLNIPNRVSTINNNSTTFKPYDPSQIEGDKTPSLATPQPKRKKGSWLGKLLAVIVGIVVTLYTAGALSGVTGGFFQTIAGGAQAMGGVSAVSVASSAAGSVAGQLVGLATGEIEQFDWKAVALSAVSAAVSIALPMPVFGDLGNYGNLVVRAAVANAVTQSVGVATGLQSRFDWRGVAASAIGTTVGEVMGGALGLTPSGVQNMTPGELFGKAMAKSMAAGAATGLARGGRVSVQQTAVDAFGNALVSTLAGTATSDPARTMGAEPAPVSERGGSVGGLKVSQSLYDSWGPWVNLPNVSLDRPAWDLYAGGTPRLSSLGAYGEQHYARTYSEAGADGGVPVYVDSETGAETTPVRPQTVLAGRALPPLALIPRVAIEPSAGQYVVGRLVQEMDGIRARLDALGEDPSTPSWLRFGAAAARGPGNWIPETVKFFARAGGYALDSQLRGQVNTGVGNFLANDPIATTKYAATRYWDDHSPLEIAADGFNLVAGGLISAPFGKLGSLAFRGTVTTATEAGETALRWTQRLSDYSIEFPQMRSQALYNFVGAVDPRPLIPTIRNLRAEAMALAPEGFDVVRISKGAAIMRYADDTYYSVPKGQYPLIPELRSMDTMGDVFTRRVQGIADGFNPASDLKIGQRALLEKTPDGWWRDKLLSSYKGSYVHDQFGRQLDLIEGGGAYSYKMVGPDVVQVGGGSGLKYEITQLTPSLNAIYKHTRNYPSELLRYVVYK